MDAEKKVAKAKNVLQEWVDKQGHDRCWYYPDLFRRLVDILEVTPSKEPALPTISEFKKGCERYQEEEFAKASGFIRRENS